VGSFSNALSPCLLPVETCATMPTEIKRKRELTGAGGLDKDTKGQIVQQHHTHEGDTGSTEVQVALFTHRINHLTEHLRTHRHDHATRRGLLQLVGKRRRLLNYLARQHVGRYQALIGRLGLRR